MEFLHGVQFTKFKAVDYICLLILGKAKAIYLPCVDLHYKDIKYKNNQIFMYSFNFFGMVWQFFKIIIIIMNCTTPMLMTRIRNMMAFLLGINMAVFLYTEMLEKPNFCLCLPCSLTCDAGHHGCES